MKLIEDIIKYSVISSKAGYVITEDNFQTRLQINVLIVSPFGTGKSTLFNKLEKQGLGYVLNDYSLAGLIGTIKANGLLLPGFIKKCAGSTLMIDEFQKFDKTARDAILNIMEHHKYTRTLGFLLASTIQENTDYCKIYAEKNFFTIEAKLSYLIGSMYFKVRSIDDLALLSRCFPITLLTDEDQGFQLYLGKSVFNIPEKLIEQRDYIANKNVHIKDSHRQYLVNITKNIFTKYRIEQGFITRALWDLTRIAGLNCLLEDREEINTDDIDLALNYIPLQIVGYSRSQLTPTQLRILDIIYSNKDGITATQISKIMKVSESAISHSISAILATGLVKTYKIGNTIVYVPVLYGDIEKSRIGDTL